MPMRTLLQFFACPDRQSPRGVTSKVLQKTGDFHAFREFTPPPRRQGGGSLRLARRAGDRLDRIAIVPLVGGKVP